MQRLETLTGENGFAFLKWIRAATLNWLNQGEIACIVTDLWRAEEITNVKQLRWNRRDSLFQQHCSGSCKKRPERGNSLRLWGRKAVMLPPKEPHYAKLRCFLEITSILSADWKSFFYISGCLQLAKGVSYTTQHLISAHCDITRRAGSFSQVVTLVLKSSRFLFPKPSLSKSFFVEPCKRKANHAVLLVNLTVVCPLYLKIHCVV